MRQSSILDGIVRGGSKPIENPALHNPVRVQNRVLIDVYGPEGLKRHVEREGNIMQQFGLNRLSEMLVSDAGGGSDFVSTGAVGTLSASEGTSTMTALGGSTASVAMAGASMLASDTGSYTTEYRMTFDDANAYSLREVGLFGSADAANGMVARTILSGGSSVNKGAADTVNISYQLIFKTVA